MIFPLKASIMIKEREREREREREICRRCVIAISMVLIEVPDSIFNFNNIQKKKKKTKNSTIQKNGWSISNSNSHSTLTLTLNTHSQNFFSEKNFKSHTVIVPNPLFLSLSYISSSFFSPQA